MVSPDILVTRYSYTTACCRYVGVGKNMLVYPKPSKKKTKRHIICLSLEIAFVPIDDLIAYAAVDDFSLATVYRVDHGFVLQRVRSSVQQRGKQLGTSAPA